MADKNNEVCFINKSKVIKMLETKNLKGFDKLLYFILGSDRYCHCHTLLIDEIKYYINDDFISNDDINRKDLKVYQEICKYIINTVPEGTKVAIIISDYLNMEEEN